MSEEYFTIRLEVIDYRCDTCGDYCKPTGRYEPDNIDYQVEHMCMNPECGQKIMLPYIYPKWDNLLKAITNGRN